LRPILNHRQIKAVSFVKENGKITNKQYQEINNVAKPTAARDLTELMEKYKILNITGQGKATAYQLKS
jgi:ATP-dependent DNA helicase RecG